MSLLRFLGMRAPCHRATGDARKQAPQAVDLVGDKLIRIDPNNGSQMVLAQGSPLAGIRSVAVVGG